MIERVCGLSESEVEEGGDLPTIRAEERHYSVTLHSSEDAVPSGYVRIMVDTNNCGAWVVVDDLERHGKRKGFGRCNLCGRIAICNRTG